MATKKQGSKTMERSRKTGRQKNARSARSKTPQRSEAQLRQVDRLYAFLSQMNQVTVRIKDRDRLFAAICDVAVEQGKFRMAWIGLVDVRTGEVKPVAHAGQEEGYLDHLSIIVDQKPTGRGPTGSAITEGKLVLCEDIARDPRMKPWRSEALMRGYRSSAAVPIRLRDTVIGSLNLYASETGFFTAEERKLLEGIGINISYALDAIEEEADRGRFEEALRRSEARYRELVENVPIWIWETDSTLRHIYTNSFVTTCLGYRPDEFLRCELLDLIHPDDREAAAEAARRATRDRKGWTGLVLRWRHKDGSWKYIESRGSPTLDAAGSVIGIHGVDQDVTERIAAADALRDSEEKFRNLVEMSSDWIWEVNEQGVYTYASPKVTDLLGYLPDEITGKTPFDLMPPDEANRVSGVFNGAKEARNPIALLENINLHKDGRAVILETSGVPLFDAQGAFHGYRGIDRDITERRHAVDALRASEYRFRTVVTNTPVVIFATDAKGVFTLSEGKGLEQLGLRPGAVVGRSALDMYRDNPEIVSNLERTLRGEPAMFESTVQGRSFMTSCNPMVDVSGRITGLIGVATDITDRKRAEDRVTESERKYRTLFDAATDAIFILDLKGNFIDVNRTAYTRLGYTREEMLSLHVGQLDSPEFSARVPERLAQIRERGTAVFESAHRRKDGSVMPVEVNARLLDYEGRKVYFSVIRDITDRKRALEEKFELERRLLHAQKLESLGVLAGGIAHDFNNLLMAIHGHLELSLRKLPPVSPAREHIEHSLHAVQRSVDLTRQMLAYSGKATGLIRNLDLSELVSENVHLFRASIPKNVSLRVNAEQSLPVVDADAAQLQQVVMNLITNAAESMGDEGGLITLTTGVCDADAAYLRTSRLEDVPRAGRYVYLEVSDSGCGMSASTQQRLFDPFFTTKTMGRGLGMSAILGIVRGHKGAIMVDSAVGEGTTVRVLFPAGDSKAVRVREPERTSAGSEPAAGAEKRRTVLIVDDEEMVRNVCGHMVQELGLNVMMAEDGMKALEILRSEGASIDCVILDLSMPKMDGLAVSREMRLLRPDISIILSSGYHEQELKRINPGEATALFIQKPYKMESLGEVLRQALKQ